MSLLSNSDKLVAYILSLHGFEVASNIDYGYTHMGAIITDAILQAGMNYRTVVAPRVNNILNRYPEAQTTSSFLHILNTYGAQYVLGWNHHVKPQRVYRLTEFFIQNSLDTDKELRTWLMVSTNCVSLLKINGIGPKTVDYIKNLVRIPTVAVDRHVRNFLNYAGVYLKSYEDIRLVVQVTASVLDISPTHLDHSIWHYMASK